MHKGKGRAQQLRGNKRSAKVLAREKRKNENKKYLAHLVQLYGPNLKLKERKQPGSDYWEWYLNNDTEENKDE